MQGANFYLNDAFPIPINVYTYKNKSYFPKNPKKENFSNDWLHESLKISESLKIFNQIVLIIDKETNKETKNLYVKKENYDKVSKKKIALQSMNGKNHGNFLS